MVCCDESYSQRKLIPAIKHTQHRKPQTTPESSRKLQKNPENSRKLQNQLRRRLLSKSLSGVFWSWENSRKLQKTPESTYVANLSLTIILEFSGYFKILVPRATPAIVRDNYAESYSRCDVPRATGLMCRELAPKSYSPFFAYSATSHLCFQHVSDDTAITTIQLALQCMLDAKLWMHRSKLRRLCNQHYAT